MPIGRSYNMSWEFTVDVIIVVDAIIFASQFIRKLERIVGLQQQHGKDALLALFVADRSKIESNGNCGPSSFL